MGACVAGLSPDTGGVANRAVMVAFIRSAPAIRAPWVRGTGIATGIGLSELAVPVAATPAVIVASRSGFDDGTGVVPGVFG